MISVILVEDDRDIAAAVVEYLELESISCDYASNGKSGLELIKSNSYQVVILDINLPRRSGYSICKELRDKGFETPILMLTARDSLEDKLTGFSVGTDDYLVKPFEMDELVARVKVLAGRRSGQNRLLKVSNVELNLGKHQATRDGISLQLPAKELALLEALMRASPEPVSREQLVEVVWGEDGPDSNSLNVHIHNLRKSVNQSGSTELIQTVAGFGYVIKERE